MVFFCSNGSCSCRCSMLVTNLFGISSCWEAPCGFGISSYEEGACVFGVNSNWEGACVFGISSCSGKEHLCAVLSGIEPATFITMSLVLYHWTVPPPCPANGNCAYQSHQHCGAVMYILKVWSDSTWLGANKATMHQLLNQKQPTASRRNIK